MEYTDYVFTVPKTLKLIGLDRKTLENWMTHQHVPQGFCPLKQRRFSFSDILTIALVDLLRSRFSVQVATASLLAHKMAADYAPRFAQDFKDIYNGKEVGATSYRPAYDMAKRADGTLAVISGDEISEGSLMIVVPVGLIARRIIWTDRQSNLDALGVWIGFPANDVDSTAEQAAK